MTTADLQEAKHKRPFEPFRLVASTGIYNIPHPEFIMVGLWSVVIGIADAQEPTVIDRTIKIDLDQVMAIREFPAQNKQMWIEELRIAKRNDPFVPFRVFTSTGQVFDICYFDHFLVTDRWVALGIPDPFRRDMLDRTVRVNYSQIVSIEPLPVPQAQSTGPY